MVVVLLVVVVFVVFVVVPVVLVVLAVLAVPAVLVVLVVVVAVVAAVIQSDLSICPTLQTQSQSRTVPGSAVQPLCRDRRPARPEAREALSHEAAPGGGGGEDREARAASEGVGAGPKGLARSGRPGATYTSGTGVIWGVSMSNK